MSNDYEFSVENKHLLVKKRREKTIIWKGKPKNLDVISILPINNSNDCIVLLDVFQADCHKVKNLLRCNQKGKIIWETGNLNTELFGIKRTNHEIYTSIEIKGDLLFCVSISGFEDQLDIKTGYVVNSVFVK